jgi:cytochrome P450 family 9
MKRFFSFFTVDVISTCAFGLEVNSFDDQYNVMQMMAKNLMEQKSLVKILKLIGIRLFPSLMKIFGIKILPKSIEKFFKETIIDAFESRRMNHITRPDMIDILLKIEIGEDIVNENGEKVQKKWSQDEIISQCLTFYFAGFRTTSTALSFAAYELALNPDIQDKLRAEVNKVNDITYENLQRIEFLDRVVKETLRKWPPAPAIERNCVKDFSFEYNNHQLIIEKGLNIMIPIFAYHRDENYFKNPEKFDPDREINSEVFMTFGLGQRTCIGSRFALMTIKLILCKMLRKFEFHVTKETQIPLKFKNGISIESEQGIWLKLRKIK